VYDIDIGEDENLLDENTTTIPNTIATQEIPNTFGRKN